MASKASSTVSSTGVKESCLHSAPQRQWVLRKGKISRKKGFSFRITDRIYALKFTWQGLQFGRRILLNAKPQVGDTCARHACVRSIEYRARMQVARSSCRRFMINPVGAVSKSPRPDFPMKFKRRKLPWYGFPRLSVQQVIDHARNDDPHFKKQYPLNIPNVMNYIRYNGVTFAKFYPTPENDVQAVVRGWKAKKRLYMRNYMVLKPSGGSQKRFLKLVVKHYVKGGPIVGAVACSTTFGEEFYSKEGYDFIHTSKDNISNEKVDYYEDDEDSEKCVASHAFTIVGHGFVRHRRLRWPSLPRRIMRRLFFLVQDSSLSTDGCFKNGLAIILGSSLISAAVPHLSTVFHRKTAEEEKKEEEEKRRRNAGVWMTLMR